MQQPIDRNSTDSSSGARSAAGACVAFLKSAQNGDGGWGFRMGLRSRVEPTAWALLAIAEADAFPEAARGGFRFLRTAQLPNGAWPPSPEQHDGSWATSLACWALARDSESRNQVTAGANWLCKDWPKDLSFVRRLIRRLRPGRAKQISTQDDSLRGWGWTPNTASWVEPTAFALLALNAVPKELLPGMVAKRRELAKAMLRNRMCAGGGWNCGNPMVYGVAGDPSIPQTVWALLALRGEPRGDAQTLGIQWLEGAVGGNLTRGLASLALAKICLDAYGRPWPRGESSLRYAVENSEFTANVATMAWAYLALAPLRRWLNGERNANG
jgi:hypothetical protein